MITPDENSPTPQYEIIMQTANIGLLTIKQDQEAPLPLRAMLACLLKKY
jgi:hypothetical protein